MSTAKLIFEDKEYEFPTVVGTESEVGIEIGKLRAQSGVITLDQGYGNTGSCESAVTFIDGEKGILRYRGYPIEELAEGSTFTEVAYLLIYDKLPTRDELDAFNARIRCHTLIHEGMKRLLEGLPPGAHPMSVLLALVASLAAYYPDSRNDDDVDLNIVRLLAKLPTIIAFGYKSSIGQPFIYPRNELAYTTNFLHMMFAVPAEPYEVNPVVDRALRLLLILHADHEQNCSTSTVRMVGSSQASLYASVAAGIGALWGPLHGGANQAVLEMLRRIYDDGNDYEKYVAMAKDKSAGFRLMGFGHRVYKNFDPRATILSQTAEEVLDELGVDDPLLDIARNLARVAREDEFFVKRNLYPNVDFYSGIIYRALGIPTDMFTVMFALGRLPGWIAQWKEGRADPKTRINRPRQIYTGEPRRPFVPIDQR